MVAQQQTWNKRRKHHDKDKYYRLAKEQGLRSRAAFKLSQINRKYKLLEGAKVVIDLCAAPGGWSQIASRSMSRSSSSIILAVDILPIRSLGPNVITIVGDITTDKCKSQIQAELRSHVISSSSSSSSSSSHVADVVLCDGAPNVGASYEKDAYAQNEIALHCLRCASHHLKYGGSFVTKLYRSSDYTSYVWVIKQLFDSVQAVKPTASRSQSAEIFLVCTGYLDPKTIDPKLLDPKFVFEQVDDTTNNKGAADSGGGGAVMPGTGRMNIFHKKYGEQKRSRNGYDMTWLDASMRHVGSVGNFIECGMKRKKQQQQQQEETNEGGGGGAHLWKDPIQMLSACTGMTFTCHMCCKSGDNDDNNNDDDKSHTTSMCNCSFYLNHTLTTAEIKTCLSDLRVLNKSDFRGLLVWRTQLQDAIKARDDARSKDDNDDDDGDNIAEMKNKKDKYDNKDINSEGEEEEEDQIQSEIAELRHKRMRERKKAKKKERFEASKRRRLRSTGGAGGMDLNHNLAFDVPDNDKIFSLATITNKGDLEAAREVDLAQVSDEQLLPTSKKDDDDEEEEEKKGDNDDDNDDEVVEETKRKEDIDEETGYSYRLDEELDEAYDRYLKNTKNGEAKRGTKMSKRTKKLERQKALEEAKEDEELINKSSSSGKKKKNKNRDTIDDDTKRYAELLTKGGSKTRSGNGSSSDDDEDNDDERESDVSDNDDGFHSVPMTPEEHRATKSSEHNKRGDMDSSKKKKKEEEAETIASSSNKNPLLHVLPDDPSSVKAARWFNNKLFDSITETAQLASMKETKKIGQSVNDDDDDDFDSDLDDGMEIAGSDDDDEGEEDAAEEDIIASKSPPKKSMKNDKKKKKKKENGGNISVKDDDDDDNDDDAEVNSSSKTTAEDVLASMPKTEKQKRHERRLKAIERKERREARRAKLLSEPEAGFEIASVPNRPNHGHNDDDDDDDDDSFGGADEKLDGLDEAKKKKILEARALIKAGMGDTAASAASLSSSSTIKNKGNNGFEIVSADDDQQQQQHPSSSSSAIILPKMDHRKYDSENEDYDSDDYAQTLALGTMMLRKSKAKALVDASYNRYAWNDPEDLPDWFVDDESKYYKPQLPIPPELIAKMKERFINLATKPIAKVAEARARKNKRAKAKLSAAKKKAESVVANSNNGSSEMTEAMKLRAISKAMRGHDASKPSKTYVVSRKGTKARGGGKGVKIVDKRMKNDKRSMDRAVKKRKNGKQGGLTGSKRRRRHK